MHVVAIVAVMWLPAIGPHNASLFLTPRATNTHMHLAQVRNAIDLARMAAAIRIFNEKISSNSNGMVTEEELQTLTSADFPTPLDLDAGIGMCLITRCSRTHSWYIADREI
jgi:hypothetical protein